MNPSYRIAETADSPTFATGCYRIAETADSPTFATGCYGDGRSVTEHLAYGRPSLDGEKSLFARARNMSRDKMDDFVSRLPSPLGVPRKAELDLYRGRRRPAGESSSDFGHPWGHHWTESVGGHTRTSFRLLHQELEVESVRPDDRWLRISDNRGGVRHDYYTKTAVLEQGGHSPSVPAVVSYDAHGRIVHVVTNDEGYPTETWYGETLVALTRGLRSAWKSVDCPAPVGWPRSCPCSGRGWRLGPGVRCRVLPCRAVTAPGNVDPPLRRSLGQHHLRSAESATLAVDFLDVSGRTVIEIGPGGGVLTRLLLERGARRVMACELDPSWAFALRRRVGERRIRLAVGDACDLAFEHAPVAARVAGNLPYNVATRIVSRVLERAPVALRAAFLVQREVADRLTATPGDGAYGALTVLTQARAAARRLAVVLPGSFVPPPAVTSAFVGLERIPLAIGEEEWAGFKALVRTAFSRRRKTLLNNLAAAMDRPAAAAAISASGLPPMVRAEALGLDEFVELFRVCRGARELPARI